MAVAGPERQQGIAVIGVQQGAFQHVLGLQCAPGLIKLA
jgi:hypothetical protein